MILAFILQMCSSAAAIVSFFADAFHGLFLAADVVALMLGLWIAAHGDTARDRIRRRFIIYAAPLFLLVPLVHLQLYASSLQLDGMQRFVMGTMVLIMPILAFQSPHLVASGMSILVRAWRRNHRRELLVSQQRIARL